MSSHEVNIWSGLLPKEPKKPTAFDIPEKSAVTASDRRYFTKVLRKKPCNMNPITLPGSSKFQAPAWQEKPRA